MDLFSFILGIIVSYAILFIFYFITCTIGAVKIALKQGEDSWKQ